jgi:hypothetical protein
MHCPNYDPQPRTTLLRRMGAKTMSRVFFQSTVLMHVFLESVSPSLAALFLDDTLQRLNAGAAVFALREGVKSYTLTSIHVRPISLNGELVGEEWIPGPPNATKFLCEFTAEMESKA